MADGPVSSPGDRIAGRTLDAATRERMLTVLQGELGRASDDVLAHGMSPEELAAQLDERIARLRAQITELSADDL
jgi:uncharacterized protein YceH (UPF0502 family)